MHNSILKDNQDSNLISKTKENPTKKMEKGIQFTIYQLNTKRQKLPVQLKFARIQKTHISSYTIDTVYTVILLK